MNRKPLILHIIDNTDPGGAQAQMESIFRALRDQFNFSVAVLGCSGRYSERYRSLEIQVHLIYSGGNRWNPVSFLPLLKLIRREKPDIIHAHLFKSMIFASLAAKLTNTTCILHDHSGMDPESYKFYFPNYLTRFLYSWAYKHAIGSITCLLVLTEQVRSGYIQYFHMPERKIDVLPNAIDIELFQSTETGSEASLHLELGLPENCKMIVMVGRLAPEKDWLTFLQVARRYPDPYKYAFIIVGSGGLKEDLHKTVSNYALSNVYFLGDRKDVPSILKEADLFLLTSRLEAFGIVILEAMAVGCPVVASRTIGPSSIIQNEGNGLLVEVGDVEGFATCLERVFSDATLANMLICNARKSLAQYDIQNVSKRISEIYTQVLQIRKTGTHD